MAKYIVKNTSIMHNGILYKEGSVIELNENHAAKLADFVEHLPNQNTAKAKAQTQNNTQNKGQASKNTNKAKPENKTEAQTKTPDTSKDGKGDSKEPGQDGGVDNDK